MMDQQNFGTTQPASADPAAIALAKALKTHLGDDAPPEIAAEDESEE